MRVNANNTGNYSCALVATENNHTTFIPQGFVYLKLNTRMGRIQLYTALFDLGLIFLLLLLISLPLTCVTPLHRWYVVQTRRYTLLVSTLYRLKIALQNLGKPADYREALRLQQLRVIMEIIEKRNLCDMVRLQEKLARSTTALRDEEEWLVLLSNEIYKLQNTTFSQTFV